jgi:ATP-dependent helicase/nuclease subunit A
MSNSKIVDQQGRDRFTHEGEANFAVSANAGSGKTTAISDRLAALAMREDGATRLGKTAVVTYTNKAAGQIGQKARAVLLKALQKAGESDLTPLDNLERAYFGTIHSFCLKLAQTYGQDLGVSLNPEVLTEEEEDASWEDFLSQDSMRYEGVSEATLKAFLRHVPLPDIFGLARKLNAEAARNLRLRKAGECVGPDRAVLNEIEGAEPKQKRSIEKMEANKQLARDWQRRYENESGFLGMVKPDGVAGGMGELFDRYFQPLCLWLSGVAGVMAAELSDRYRLWRFEQGVQTYDDQIDATLAVLRHPPTLDRIRREGWRVILDEAQDTDPAQFSILIEITRELKSEIGEWPGQGSGPRKGHFCMVGDGQQSIYGSRADIRNFVRHLAAFERGDGGELLKFQVTFRAPQAVASVLNSTLPDAFGEGREFNCGLPPEEGAPAPFLQVPYVPLRPGPSNDEGSVSRVVLKVPEPAPKSVDAWMEEEIRQLADYLLEHGPSGVGAKCWGDICILAPRNKWLLTARKSLESAGLKVALQMRKNRNGDNPAYAWLAGLLAVISDPENTFEWTGVLREVFAISDGLIAAELRTKGRFEWESPEAHALPLREALEVVRPFIMEANDEGVALDQFIAEMVNTCGLRGKLAATDSNGLGTAELDRLLALAAKRGLEGMSPREWCGELLDQLEAGRPSGQPSADAINVLTSHSSKGLEWPVVIPVGLWRKLGKNREDKLLLVTDQNRDPRVYLSSSSLSAEMKESRDREWLREQVRLLYVTLTRARSSLVLPWGKGFGGKLSSESMARMWWADLDEAVPMLARDIEIQDDHEETVTTPEVSAGVIEIGFGRQKDWPILPQRVLPHQLAHEPDLVRQVLSESDGMDEFPAKPGPDPIDYGLWWHETMEFMPMAGSETQIDSHFDESMERASFQGFAGRAYSDWQRLREGPVWGDLHSPRWKCAAELNIFAPYEEAQWIDGVIDLVLHDEEAKEVWVVDWKTNRRRRGESDAELLARLSEEYTPQLVAYGRCLEKILPNVDIKKWLYSSETGTCVEIKGV